MHTRCIGRTFLALSPLAILSPLLLLNAGCGDDSKRSGTQVQLSEEAKVQVNDMRDMYKSQPKSQGKQKK